MQDGERDDFTAAIIDGICAIADDAPIECAIAIGAFISGSCCAVVGANVGIDGVEHITPVSDIGHVLEGS